MPQTLKLNSFCIFGYRDFDAYLRLFADAKEKKGGGSFNYLSDLT